jgi:hypothetical protein
MSTALFQRRVVDRVLPSRFRYPQKPCQLPCSKEELLTVSMVRQLPCSKEELLTGDGLWRLRVVR